MIKVSLSVFLAALNTLLIAAASPTATTATKSVQVVAPASTKASNGASIGVNDSDTAQTDQAPIDRGSLEARVLVDVDPDAPIKPRRVNAKVPVRGPGSIETRISPTTPKSGNVVFKVRDDLKARTGMTFGMQLTSAAATNGQGLRLAPTAGPGTDKDRELDEIRAVLSGHSATIRQCISMTPAELTALEGRARNISRVEQPDLAGIIYARAGAAGKELELAEALNELPSVEYAEVEYLPHPAQDSCQKDVSLQKGSGSAGSDVQQGTNCTSYTDNQGNPRNCPTPPPVFIAQNGLLIDPVITGPDAPYPQYFPQAAPLGVVPCQSPSRWNSYTSSVLAAELCETGLPSYIRDNSPLITFDCTPNCNQGGSPFSGGNGECATPPLGFTSSQSCQYGCQDAQCADIVTGQGFGACNNPDSVQGWDALCATIANIYCGVATGFTPYQSTGAFLPQGRNNTGWLPDEGTQTCYQLSQASLATTWAAAPGVSNVPFMFGSSGIGTTAGGSDGDASTYDPCFARRGPANPPPIDPTLAAPGSAPIPYVGIVSYTDVGDGSGIRPWGFEFVPSPTAGARAYANAFLQASTPSGDFEPGECPLGLSKRVGGDYLWNVNPNSSANAVLAEYNLALKSYPYYFSHDCNTPSDVTPGCYLTQCCVYVCIQDPSCCTVAWDNGCVTTARNSVECSASALSPVQFPATGDTPDFRGSPSASTSTAQGFQVWNIGLPVATSCSQYVANYPTALPGPIPLATITKADISSTPAMLNTGFGGGGLDVGPAVASVSASYPFINSAMIAGSGLNIGVIDSSCFPDHEALADAYNSNRLIIEPGQTLVITPPNASPLVDPDHGTAVLAMLIGRPVNGGGGVNSVLPEATAYFFPSVSQSEGGRLPTAIARAGQTLQPGDILAIPLSFSGNYNSGSSTALSAVQTLNTLLGICFSMGITAFQPAGNGGFQVGLTPSGGAGETTYCVTVGACWPGSETSLPTGTVGLLNFPRQRTFPGNGYCRYMTSNWTPTQGPSADAPGIDVAGWGTGIVTAGYGLLWTGDNAPSTSSVYSNPTLTTNRLRTYQYNFGGTSGASAQIACLGGMMQGFAKTYFGAPISPGRVRQILANQLDPNDGGGTGYLNTCIRQCQLAVGATLPSTLDDRVIVVKNGDLVVLDGLTPHQVGGFPLASPCLYAVSTTTFNPGGTPFDLTIVKGTVRSGGSNNASYGFACARLDNYFLKIQGVRAGRGSTGQAYGPPFPYAANGLVTDIQLRAKTQLSSTDSFDNMSLSATGAATNGTVPPGGTNNTALTMAYVYNRVSRRWNFLAFGFLSRETSTPIATNLAATYMPSSNFLITEGSDKVVYFRVVTYPFGIVGPYQAWWDLFDIQTNSTLPTK